MAKRILLADDSITIQKVVELTFSDGDYEVTAVNNGAKAIQKLSEMRPDIILSDIIMPEKNGYEVCEFVKSHPEYRNIPVVLLTGTFEPFDPDRADKAGCDAVVTKPFESQSLIHKVEELIDASKSAAPTAPQPAVEPEPESFGTESPFAPEPEPTPPAAAEPFGHGGDIFGAAPAAPEATSEMPFDNAPSYGGETRAFPRMSFDELQRMAGEPEAATPPPPAPAEPSPWDEPATSGETRAFPRMSFDELQRMPTEPAAPPPAPPAEPSPWDEAPMTGGETRAFPAMSFDELQNQQPAAEPFGEPEPPPAPAAEASPWDETPMTGGETRAFPRMSFDELQQMASQPAAAPEPPPAPEPAPWDESPVTGGETRAFPRMSFDELQQMASQPAAAPEPEPEPEPAPEPAMEASPWDEPAPAAPAWSPAEPETSEAPAESFATEAASPFADSLADQETPFEPEVTPPLPAEEPAWSPSEPAAFAEAEPTPVNPQITDAVTAAEVSTPGDLTDDQIDRIARRVVQLMSEQVVRNIAWEVIPDMAEMVVKERIRQLEAQD